MLCRLVPLGCKGRRVPCSSGCGYCGTERHVTVGVLSGVLAFHGRSRSIPADTGADPGFLVGSSCSAVAASHADAGPRRGNLARAPRCLAGSLPTGTLGAVRRPGLDDRRLPVSAAEGQHAQARTGLVRVGLGLLVGTVGYVAPYSAAATVLLPARIADLHPDEKIQLLALLTGAAAVASLVANVLFGALSDLTRTRFGARTPWILGGAVTTALLLVPISRAGTFGELLLWWCLAAATLNATVAALVALLPDRVPVARRATVSAVIGIGILIGSALGAVTGAVFLDDPERGIQVTAVLLVVLSVTAVLIAPDHDNRAAAGGRLDLHGLAGSFRFPRGAPDFYWALWGRLLLVLSYFMVYGFQLYIFTDHVGLDEAATARAIGLTSVVFLVTALVGSALAGPASDRLGRRKAFVVTASLLAMAAVAIPLVVPTTAGMVGFSAIGGLAFGIYYAVDAALMSEVLPSSESRARDLGILNMANTGCQVLAPAASAALVGLGLGFLPVFAGAMIMAAVGAACVTPIRSVR